MVRAMESNGRGGVRSPRGGRGQVRGYTRTVNGKRVPVGEHKRRGKGGKPSGLLSARRGGRRIWRGLKVSQKKGKGALGLLLVGGGLAELGLWGATHAIGIGGMAMGLLGLGIYFGAKKLVRG